MGKTHCERFRNWDDCEQTTNENAMHRELQNYFQRILLVLNKAAPYDGTVVFPRPTNIRWN